MGPTTLFTHLKIILLQCFQFSVLATISSIQTDPLGLNVLELHFVLLANHDQNVLVLFRLAQSICFLCKVGIELL